MSARSSVSCRGLYVAFLVVILSTTVVLTASPATAVSPSLGLSGSNSVRAEQGDAYFALSGVDGLVFTSSPVPTITGIPQAGRRLRVAAGSWKPAPVALTYQWMVGGVPVAGATASVFTPTSRQVGQRVTVSVTGAKTGYRTLAKTSGPSRLIAPATITVGARPSKIVVTADGRWAYVANSGSDTVSVISVSSGKIVGTVPVGGNPTGMSISSDQKHVFVSTCADEKVYAIDIGFQTVSYSFTTGTCGDLLATIDGKYLYIGGSPTLTDITVATIATRSLAEPIYTGAPAGELTLSANRSQAYLSNGDDYAVIGIHTSASASLQDRYTTSHPPVASAPSPDGKTLYASLGRDLFTGPANTVEVIDIATNRIRASVAINEPGDLEVSPDGTRLYVVSRTDATVVTINTQTNRVISRIPVGRSPISLAVTPDGTKVGIANRGENTVSVLPVF